MDGIELYIKGFHSQLHSNTIQNLHQNWLDLLYGRAQSKLCALLSGFHLGIDVHVPITAAYTCHFNPLHEEVLLIVLNISKDSY